jgi:hypothetical protein
MLGKATKRVDLGSTRPPSLGVSVVEVMNDNRTNLERELQTAVAANPIQLINHFIYLFW